MLISFNIQLILSYGLFVENEILFRYGVFMCVMKEWNRDYMIFHFNLDNRLKKGVFYNEL